MTSSRLGFTLIAALTVLLPCSLSAQIINIDFLAQRGAESVATNYVGQGAAGGGTIFNGIAANNSASTDVITVTGSNLKDSYGGVTTVGFLSTPIGADNSGDHTFGILNGAYLFVDSGNNHSFSVPFTISGLTSPTVDLYFFGPSGGSTGFDPVVTLAGGTSVTYAGSISPFNAGDTTEFINVPVIGGQVTGTFSPRQLTAGFPAIIGGITIVEVPEPSTWAMLGLGAVVLGWRLRRRVSI